MSGGKHVAAFVDREVVMSEARRRKHAVWVRTGRGVVGRWVVKKVVSQVGEGVRPFVEASWVEFWVVGLDIFGEG